MDDARLDALARILVGRISRCGALGVMAAGGLVPLTVGAAPEPTGCLPNDKRCVDRGVAPRRRLRPRLPAGRPRSVVAR